MLVRRLAGPSRALFRHMATAAAAEEPGSFFSHSAATGSAVSSSDSSTRPGGRRALHEASGAAASAPASPPATAAASASRSSRVQQLLDLIDRPLPTDMAANTHDDVWRMYRQLTRQERELLGPKDLARVLRAVVPRYQHYWKYLYRTPKRLHQRVLTDTLAADWELRLRTVMGELAAADKVYREDWWFALRTLSNMGLVTSCEAIVRQLPDALRHHSTTAELRLGAVIRWARNILDTEQTPAAAQVELAHDTFWDIFRHMDSTQIHTFTLRLLLSATAEVCTLVKSVNHAESLQRLNDLVDFIVKQGYGIDLANLPMSVQQASQPDTGLPRLSAKGLSAILRHLVLRDVGPQRLVTAFEILRVKESSSDVNYSSRVDEDDEDFGPMAEPTGQADTDRRNWLGFKVHNGEGGPDSREIRLCACANSPADGATEQPSEPTSTPQGRRFRLDFLPSIPSPSTITVPTTSMPLPPTTTYNDESIVILLAYLRQHRHTRLFTHTLETALYDAKASQAAWLPAYLSCPAEQRAQLQQPLRIAPEWFRIALAYSSENYYRWSPRFVRSIADAAAWTRAFTDVILHTEAARGVQIATARGRPALPTPEFAAKPRTFRMLRNAHVFVVSDAVEGLQHDVDQLESLVRRGEQLEARRLKWRVA